MDWRKRILGLAESAWQGQPPRAKAYEISGIYPGSVAEAAELRPHMLYIPRDKRSAPSSEWKDREETGVGAWTFIDESRQALIELRTRGFPFGMKLRRTVEGLCDDIGRGEEYSDEIFERIHDGDDAVFARLVEALERPVRLSAGNLPSLPKWRAGWLSGRERPIFRRWRPNQMAAGVFHALHGRLSRARELMVPFEEETAAASLQTSLYAFGQAVIAEADGAAAYEVEGWLERAVTRHPKSRRIRNYMIQRGLNPRDDLEKECPRPFPLNYCLIERDPLEPADPLRQPFVCLRDTLAGLEPDEFLIVIMLGAYRGNGYYVALLDQFMQVQPLVGRHFPVVHVITSHERGARHFDEWLGGERRVLRSGFPLKVLHDPGDFVATMLDITGSPTAAIVDKGERIVYQGSLCDDEGYWTALASLREGRGAARHGPFRRQFACGESLAGGAE